MAQREPVLPQTDNSLGLARQRRAELRRLLGELENRSKPMTAIEHERLIRTAWNAFADVPMSSFEFMRRKHRELDEEEARLGEGSTP